MGLPKNTTHIMQPLDTHVFGPSKRKWKEEIANLTMRDVELRKENFGEHFFPFYSEFMDQLKDVITKSFQDTGLCPLDSSKPSYFKLKVVERNSQPTENVKFKAITRTRQSSLDGIKEQSSQTESRVIAKATNTNITDTGTKDESMVQSTSDDMVLHLRSSSEEKRRLSTRAAGTFGDCPKKQSIIRSRSDLFISDVSGSHRFFPLPQQDSKKSRNQKTREVELLPTAISSKEWKAYVETKRDKKKMNDLLRHDKRKRSQNDLLSANGTDAHEPKRNRGRPRKKPTTDLSDTATEPEKPPTDFQTPDCSPITEAPKSAFKIVNIAKPKRIWTGLASAINVGDLKRSTRLGESEELPGPSNAVCQSDIFEVGEYMLIEKVKLNVYILLSFRD